MASGKENLKKNALSGVIWKFMERVSAQLVSLVVQIVLARILVPEDYAVVGIVSIFFAICNVLISGGLNTALIQKKDADIEDYSTVLHISMLLAAVLYVVMFLAAPGIASIYNNELLIPIFRVMSLTFFFHAFTSVLSAYASSNLMFKKFFYSTMIGTVVSAVVGITMAMNGFGAWALVAQQMTNAFCNSTVLYFTTKLKIVFKISFSKLMQLFAYGSKVFIASIISVIYDQTNPLIIGLKFTSTDLSFYTKGQSFPGLLNSSINDTLSAVLFPVISKVQDSKDDVLNVTRRYIKVASYIIFPMMVGLLSVAEAFVSVVLTDKWLPAVPYIQIFSFSYMFNIIQTGNLQAIKAIGRSDILLLLEVMKKSVYFAVIAAFVIFSNSPVMLAVSGIICTFVATLVNTFPNRKLIGYRYRQQAADLLPNFLQAAAMGSVVMLVGQLDISRILLLVLQIVTGVIVYVMLSILTRNENFFYLIDYLKLFLKRK